MHIARHSGWLGPSNYIEPFPQLQSKQRLNVKVGLAVSIPVLTILSVVGVNFLIDQYAATKVAYYPAERQISTAMSPKTLSAVALTDANDVNSRIKQVLNNWSQQKRNINWSVAVQSLDNKRINTGLNSELALNGLVFANNSKTTAEMMYQLYQRGEIYSVLNYQPTNRGVAAGCSGCKVISRQVEGNNFRHEVALVRYVAGEYLLVVQTDGASYSQIAQLASSLHSEITKH